MQEAGEPPPQLRQGARLGGQRQLIWVSATGQRPDGQERHVVVQPVAQHGAEHVSQRPLRSSAGAPAAAAAVEALVERRVAALHEPSV